MIGRKAWLVIETGQVYEGNSFGASGQFLGEVVFNTGTTGYVEVLTDPSYCGQIVVMTQPHIGNYGIQPGDVESKGPFLTGFCVRSLTELPRHTDSRHCVDSYLREHGIGGVSGLPTREITRQLRLHGSLRGMITTEKQKTQSYLAHVRKSPPMTGRSFVNEVSARKPYLWKSKKWEGKKRVAVLDFGVKQSVLNVLKDYGCSVKVFPAQNSEKEIARENPDAIVLSNGPGDPAALKSSIENIRQLLKQNRPTLGICLGHQLLGLALGAKAFKLKFGHHGVNHPVKEQETGKILITSQNHGFAIRPDTLPKEYVATHISLNDGTLEGFRHRRKPIFSFQFHPEAGPGPIESRNLLREFVQEI